MPDRPSDADAAESHHDEPALEAPEGAEQPIDAEPGDEHDDARFFRELPVLIIVALVVAIVIKTFLVQAFYIPSQSMEPTLEKGDRVLVCRFCYRIGDIQRGEVIVFSDPSPTPGPSRGPIGSFFHWLGEGIGLAQPADEDFIKRVIGLPSDVVQIRAGQLYVNNEVVDEPYLDPRKDTRSYGPMTVPDGMLFVLGDNRVVSGDSRFPPPTGVGLVPEDKVIGKAFVIVWPPGRWGWL